MTIRTFKSFSIVFTILLWFCSCEQSPQNISPVSGYESVASKLSDAIKYEITSKNLNAISIVLVDDQKIVWSQGFGIESKKTKKQADAHTVYRVGSVSKLFTDMAIMQRVESGEIDLDAAIQTYLPDFKPNNPYGKPITLRQLMSHRSGLLREPRLGNYFTDDEISLKRTVESIIPSTLVYAPESKIKYSNAAIAVVGYTLEHLYGQPYVAYMQKHILDRVGMDNSAFAPNRSIKAKLAQATMWSYDGREFPAPTFELGMIPAGSLYAPMLDLGQFLITLFNNGQGKNGQVISKETLTKMWSPQFGGTSTSGYGIGFSLSEMNGHQKVGHGGAIYGFSTQISALPELKLGAACASSVDLTNAITTHLTDYALKLMLARQDNKPLPDYPKSEQLDLEAEKKLVGTFQNDDSIIDIRRKNGNVVLSAGRFEVPLRQSSKAVISDGRIVYNNYKVSPEANGITVNGRRFAKIEAPRKSEVSISYTGLIGEYGWDHNILYIYEDQGNLWGLIEWFEKDKLTHVQGDVYALPINGGMYHGELLEFKRDPDGNATEVSIINGPIFKRRDVGASTAETFRIEPVKPMVELRKTALGAIPPSEDEEFLTSDLVELHDLDESIQYDIRYATTNNFMSAEFYTLAEAYMQRPAAEALVRAHRKLKEKGYGLLIHDAYRPWYVTKMFWDATPEDKKIFVANPANGSRHNRGCAIDLTLYDLKTGQVVEMVAGYDEMTDRSFPDYYGGTTVQRWHRKLLRDVMETEGFSVYEFEWWHFDYKDWRKYPLGNKRFEEL